VEALAEAAHRLDHQERRNLNGWNSCGIFFAGKERAAHSKRLRKEIYDGLIETQFAIIAAMDGRQNSNKEAAWRIAVEQWTGTKPALASRACSNRTLHQP
jgi:hypothetical protein